MFISLRRLTQILLLAFFFSLSSNAKPRPVMPIDLDNLAEKLAPEIDKAGIKFLAVVNFAVADEPRGDLGWYLSDKLSDSIVLKSPATSVVDRMRLEQLGLASVDMLLPDTLKRLATTAGADALVSGKIEVTREKYLLTVALERVSDGATLATITYTLPHSRILDLLSATGDHALGAASRAGVMGVGVPGCLYCPVPADTRNWRSNQPQNVVLQVIISVAGAAEKISVVRSPGYYLSERAIEAVSEWKFRPAPGADGKPTPVIVPIEVTFKTSRT